MLWSALILGFLGSWHCIGMCGPIAMMVPGSAGKQRWVAASLYHGGKILSYALIGSVFGLFSVFVSSFQVQSVITIGAGIVIGILAFMPSLLNYAEKKGFKVFSSLIGFKNKLSAALDKDRIEYGFYIGFFNGFIPCGMVYIAAIGALVQPSFIQSVAYMALFGIGTIPMLTAIIISSGWIKKKMKSRAPQLRLIAMVFISGFMIWKGISNLNTEIEQPKAGDDFQICATHP